MTKTVTNTCIGNLVHSKFTEDGDYIAQVANNVRIGIDHVSAGEYPITEKHDDGFIVMQVGNWSHSLTPILQQWFGITVKKVNNEHH